MPRSTARPLGHLNLSLDMMPVIAASSSNETNCYVYLSSETDSRGIAAPSNTADPTPWPVQWTVPPHYENSETPRSSPLMAVIDCHRARIPVSGRLMLETILRSHALTITVLIMIFTGCRYFPLQPPCAFIIFMLLNLPAQPSAPRRQRIYHARGLTRGQQS
ncbi:hypothetical protein BDR06DRAFT_45761 [Suillus hirtellus]|nr:hypothetical protein BDR06DRAFT_45761 [Suillus hirtellus]